MSLLDFIFGPGKTPTPQRISTQARALVQRHGDPSFRYQAADTLAGWGTPEAITALLDRFSVNVASETSDEAEKSHVGELITDKIGRDAVEPLETYMTRHEQVAWPLRLLSRIVEPDEFRERIVRVLGKLDTHFDRLPERKVEILHFLVEHAQHADVADATHRFLEDTDDRVRIAAIELLKASARQQDFEAMATCWIGSADRPRVRAALHDALVDRPGAFAGRVEGLSAPEGFVITADGTLAKEEAPKAAAPRRK